MNPKPSNDPFGIEAAFKQISDTFSGVIEQAKRAKECKMRRFYIVDQQIKDVICNGIVFPDGTAIIQWEPSGSLNIYRSYDDVTTGLTKETQWIDPESAA